MEEIFNGSIFIQVKQKALNKYLSDELERLKISSEENYNLLKQLIYQAIDTYRKQIDEQLRLTDIELLEGESINLNKENTFDVIKHEIEERISLYEQFANFNLTPVFQIIYDNLDYDIEQLTRYYLLETNDDYVNLVEEYLDGTDRLNEIVNLSFEEFNKNTEIEGTVDLVLTDPPYFIGYNEDWDKPMTNKERFNFFRDYIRSLNDVVKEDARILIFNDYMNVDIIEKAMKDVTEDSNYPNINLKIMSYIEWVKQNPQNAKKRGDRVKKVHKAIQNWRPLSVRLKQVKKKWDKQKNKKKVFKNWNNSRLKKKHVYYRKLNSIYDFAGFYNESEYLIVSVNQSYDELATQDFEEAGLDIDYYEYFKDLSASREIFESVNADNQIREVDGRIHSTTKNPAVINELILRFSEAGDLVLDNFSGSGAIALSAYENDRYYLASERDKYMYQLSKVRLDRFKKMVGKRPFPFKINIDFDFKEGYMYKKYEDLIMENYYNPLSIMTIEERKKYTKANLINIFDKYPSKLINIETVTDEEIGFLLGFTTHYQQPLEFEQFYRINRMNIEQFFKVFPKFPVDKALRFYHREFIKWNIPFKTILDDYSSSKRLKNYKNKDKYTKQFSIKSYINYLNSLQNSLLLSESTIQKVMSRKPAYLNDELGRDTELIKNYYSILTQITVYKIFLANKWKNILSEDDECLEVFYPNYLSEHQLVSSYALYFLEDEEKVQLFTKLGEKFDIGSENARELWLAKETVEGLNPTVKIAIKQGLIEVLKKTTTIKYISDFDIANIRNSLIYKYKQKNKIEIGHILSEHLGKIYEIDTKSSNINPNDLSEEELKKKFFKFIDESFKTYRNESFKADFKKEEKRTKIDMKSGMKDRRKKVEVLIEQGKKAKEIAKELDVTVQTIYLDIQEIEKEKMVAEEQKD